MIASCNPPGAWQAVPCTRAPRPTQHSRPSPPAQRSPNSRFRPWHLRRALQRLLQSAHSPPRPARRRWHRSLRARTAPPHPGLPGRSGRALRHDPIRTPCLRSTNSAALFRIVQKFGARRTSQRWDPLFGCKPASTQGRYRRACLCLAVAPPLEPRVYVRRVSAPRRLLRGDLAARVLRCYLAVVAALALVGVTLTSRHAGQCAAEQMVTQRST